MQHDIKEAYEPIFKPTAGGRPIAPEYTAFAKSWNWYKVIADLSDNQILNFDAVTTRPVKEVFTFLLYQREKNIAEEAQRKLNRFLTKNKNADS